MRHDITMIGVSGLTHLADLVPLTDSLSLPRLYFRKVAVYSSVAAGMRKLHIIAHPPVETGLRHLAAPDGEYRFADFSLQVYAVMFTRAASLGHKITAAVRIMADDYGVLLILNRTKEINLIQLCKLANQITR